MMIIELDDEESMDLLLALREAEQHCYNEPQLRRLRGLRDRIRTARELPGEAGAGIPYGVPPPRGIR